MVWFGCAVYRRPEEALIVKEGKWKCFGEAERCIWRRIAFESKDECVMNSLG